MMRGTPNLLYHTHNTHHQTQSLSLAYAIYSNATVLNQGSSMLSWLMFLFANDCVKSLQSSKAICYEIVPQLKPVAFLVLPNICYLHVYPKV